MSLPGWLVRLKPDNFVLALIGAVIAACLLPVRGEAADGLTLFSKFALAALFFLHGARLPRDAVVKALGHWRLHLLVLALSFAAFPLLALGAATVARPLLTPELAAGLIFLGCLPSTIQSSVAFTSIARGNVAAAVACASLSNVVGMLLTPLLVAALLSVRGGGLSLEAVEAIALQLLAPFIAGQIARQWIGALVDRHKKWLGVYDRSVVALMVYIAFSEAVIGGVWGQVSALQILGLIAVCAVLLAAILVLATLSSRKLGFDKADEITIVFCGSKKTITGVAMAAILFPPAAVGLMVLPLMVFHQIQLMTCAFLARRYSERTG